MMMHKVQKATSIDVLLDFSKRTGKWGCKCIWENCDSLPDTLEGKELDKLETLVIQEHKLIKPEKISS